MEKRKIHCAHMGHGLVFYDISNEINGDYEKVAFSDSNRVVQLYANNLNDEEKNLIFDRVKNSDSSISVCQPECKIFNIPPNKDYEYIKEEKYYYPHLDGIKITPIHFYAFRNDTLKLVKEVAKEHGLRVFACNLELVHDICFLIITDGKNIGYVQTENPVGIKISTKTRFGLQFTMNKLPLLKEDITIDKIKESFAIAPDWIEKRFTEDVVKYEDIEDYLSLNTMFKYVEI